MSNIFIKETENFYNYISTTHCKDFINEYNDFYYANIEYYLDFFNTKKKKTRTLCNLYKVLRNNEFVKIKNYIYREYTEENEFEEWVKTLKNFADFVFNFSDPLLFNRDDYGIIARKDDKNCTMIIKHKIFDFSITFEKSKIKKSSSSLFDTITGLDKESNLSFITIEITNKSSGTKYTYNYMEDSTLNPKNSISEETCDMQLEYVKCKLDEFIYDYIGIIFDNIVNRELNRKYDRFIVFNSKYIRYVYKEMEEEWLKNMNME